MMEEESIYSKTFNPLDDFDPTSQDDDQVGPRQRAPPRIKWFHGNISREAASQLLFHGDPGSYLVRESSVAGDFSISFRVAKGVKHFKIIRHEYGDFFIADNRFQLLEEVVEHYYNVFLSDNLPLRHPLAPVHPVTEQSGQGGASAVVVVIPIVGSGPSELTCSQGERLTVLNKEDPHWLYCSQHNGAKSGFVSRRCVQEISSKQTLIETEAISQLPSNFKRANWIHGKIDRKQAEVLLESEGLVGSFLVRASENNNYSLSFRGPKKTQHFRIRWCNEFDYECGGRNFNCLEAVVLRYHSEPLMDGMSLRFPFSSSVMPVQQQHIDVDGDLYSDVQAFEAIISAKANQAGAAPKPVPVYESMSDVLSSSSSVSKVKKGYIVKKSKNRLKWKSLFFVLLPEKRRLEYFDDEDSFKPKGLIDLDACTIYPLDNSFFGRPNCFQILVQSSEIFLCCDTESEMREWMSALSDHCANCGYAQLSQDTNAKSQIRSLNITVVEAKKFGTKYTMPYCIVQLNNINCARTPVLSSKTDNPFWNEEFQFDNLSTSVTSVTVLLFNRGKGKRDKLISSVLIPLEDLLSVAEYDKWADLSIDGSAVGSMRLKATFINGVLLPLKDYAPLTTLLMDQSMVTALLLAEISKSKLNDLANNLVKVWIPTGNVCQYLATLIEKEVSNEKKVATLFRGNSLGTKCMDQFMKIVAMPFLQKAVAVPVRKMFEDKRSCEIDVTRKGGANDNIHVLVEHVEAIMSGLHAAVDACPRDLKVALQSIREAAASRWPEAADVKYTSVSAFVFLRLVCPAILNPKLFNMMPDVPSETIQRNLTLVAKVVQNMANMTEFGAKEEFMTPCNTHIQQNRPLTQKLLQQLSTADGTPAKKERKKSGANVMSQHAHAHILRTFGKSLSPIQTQKTQVVNDLALAIKKIQKLEL
eukprot:m.225988 g.225988  ORF g.225988 m.225988 type:complete len:925 (-) comp33476_c0_seq1:73-2847(-)